MAHASFIAESLEQRQLLASVNTANELTKIANVVGEDLVQAGELFFFIERLPDDTRKVWRSDGTSAGTFRVSEVNQRPGASHSLTQFAVLGDRVFFAADDGVHGTELWTSDGTHSGTRMVADINPGPASSTPANLAAANGRVYFAADNGVVGREPWSADLNGAALVSDIYAGSSSSNASDFIQLNDSVLFIARGDQRQRYLYRLDENAAPFALARFGIRGSAVPAEPTLVGDRVFFFVQMLVFGGQLGTYLWHTDGTELGTRRIDRLVSPEWYLTDNRFSPIAFGDQLIFRGLDWEHGWEPWFSDGTESGTQLIKDINPGLADGMTRDNSALFARLGEALFFSANDGVHNKELWSTDGTQFNTRMLRDLAIAGGTSPRAFGVAGDKIFFGTTWNEIGLTNGSAAGTALLGYGMQLRSAPISRGTGVFMLTDKGFYKAAAVDNLPPVVNVAYVSNNPPVSAVARFSEDVRASLTFEEIVLRNVDTGERMQLDPEDVVWDDASFGRVVTIAFNSYFPSLPNGNYRLSFPAGGVQDVWGNVSQSDRLVDFFSLFADLNRDRLIDSRDFSLLAANFNQAATYGNGDINRSGRVDIADFAILAPLFNTYLAPPPAPRELQSSTRELAPAFATVPFSSRFVDDQNAGKLAATRGPREVNLTQNDDEILS